MIIQAMFGALLACWVTFPALTHAWVSAIFTFAFAFFATMYACEKEDTRIFVILGLVLYAASWPIAATFGVWVGMLVWMPGVFLWFRGVIAWSLDLYQEARVLAVRIR